MQREYARLGQVDGDHAGFLLELLHDGVLVRAAAAEGPRLQIRLKLGLTRGRLYAFSGLYIRNSIVVIVTRSLCNEICEGSFCCIEADL